MQRHHLPLTAFDRVSQSFETAVFLAAALGAAGAICLFKPEFGVYAVAAAYFLGAVYFDRLFDLVMVRKDQFAPWLKDYKDAIGWTLTAAVWCVGVLAATRWPRRFSHRYRFSQSQRRLGDDGQTAARGRTDRCLYHRRRRDLPHSRRPGVFPGRMASHRKVSGTEGDCRIHNLSPPSWQVGSNYMINGIGDIDLVVKPVARRYVVEIKCWRYISLRSLRKPCCQVLAQATYVGADEQIVWFPHTKAAKNAPRRRRLQTARGNIVHIVEGGPHYLLRTIKDIEDGAW